MWEDARRVHGGARGSRRAQEGLGPEPARPEPPLGSGCCRRGRGRRRGGRGARPCPALSAAARRGRGRAQPGPPRRGCSGGADGAGGLAALAGRLLRLLRRGGAGAREGAFAQVRPPPSPSLTPSPRGGTGLSPPPPRLAQEEGCSHRRWVAAVHGHA